ncbi:MAG: family 10 glycosylhydrolase, partial [Planctomycetaceae bacterium]
ALDANGQTSAGTEFLDDTLSFAYPGARQAKIDVMMDLVNGYGIDGIFLDFTRYLYGFGYDQPVLDELQTNYGFDARLVPVPPVGSPQQGTTEWQLFSELRAQNVQTFVQEFGDAVAQSTNPLTVGTFSDHRWGMDLDINHLGRNFPAWAQAGLVDEVWIGNYSETPVNQIQSVVSNVRAAVGTDVRLNAALTTWNNHLTTQAEFFGAVREAFLGSADNMFLYREDFLNSNSLWDEATAANEKLNHFLFPTSGTAHASYEAATEPGLPVGGVGGWVNDGLDMVKQGNHLLQAGSLPLSVSRYRTTAVTPGLMDQTSGYYTVDFEVRPLEDLDLTAGDNPFNLHVQWADDQSIYNVVIDLDSDDGGAGSLGSINYGGAGTSHAIAGIDWSTSHQVSIAFHANDQNFYFYLDDEFVSYVTISNMRIGDSSAALQDTLVFGDSSDQAGDVAAQWYEVSVYGVGVYDPALAGDFDGDGDVDGADFLVFQRGFGNDYDANDLADWENNYGMSLATAVVAAAVPEPATGGMLMLGMVVCLFWMKKG